jgi:hypothetical protein
MKLVDIVGWAVPGALLKGGAFFTSGIVHWMLPSNYEYTDDVGTVGGTIPSPDSAPDIPDS